VAQFSYDRGLEYSAHGLQNLRSRHEDCINVRFDEEFTSDGHRESCNHLNTAKAETAVGGMMMMMMRPPSPLRKEQFPQILVD
jgi:hypothetical protein